MTRISVALKRVSLWDFPIGLVVKTPRFYFRGMGSILVREQTPKVPAMTDAAK